MKKSSIIAGIIVLPIIIAAWMYASYLASTRPVEIIFTNAHDVVITETENPTKSETRVDKSPSSVRLSKDAVYTISYKGNDGYTDGTLPITKESSSITIDPDYSISKNNELLAAALPEIKGKLHSTYREVETIYAIEPVSMRSKGEWASIRLVYKGEYSENSDTLRALFHKQKDGWTLACTPDIIVTKTKCPTVTTETLSWLNTSF